MMADGKISTAFIYGANPAYHLPKSYEFEKALKGVPLVVSISTHLDDTARLAHYILPPNTPLESWGDQRPYEGVYSLLQPVMQPVFDTREAGDILIQLGQKAGKGFSKKATGETPLNTFEDYLKAGWTELYQTKAIANDFNKFWLESLERGGLFDAGNELPLSGLKIKTSRSVLNLSYELPERRNSQLPLLVFPSLRTFSGHASNRPWLLELPDPMSQAIWDSWVEIHPETASKFGLAKGDMVSLAGETQELSLPLLLTEYVSPGVVAVPLGFGQPGLGRYAAKIESGNPLKLMPGPAGLGLTLCGGAVTIARGRGRSSLVVRQGSDSQQGRALARTRFINEPQAPELHEAQPKQMYQQREHPLYQWGLAVDLNACIGCSACVVACYAENNLQVVGKTSCSKGREMSWLRIERYHDGDAKTARISFLPMMCQHCHNASCEPVCPVYATYHNEEGLNAMIYNRCVGTRYCSNNCPYKVRRFNWYRYEAPDPLNWQFNPDVVRRSMGVMEKCTFCVQRIVEAKDQAKDLGRLVQDGEIQPACVQSCPTRALTFGNLNDPESQVSRLIKNQRAYKVLDEHINTQPAISYLERLRYRT
jgi:Fe-S-cluster-containing dehydrogenase component